MSLNAKIKSLDAKTLYLKVSLEDDDDFGGKFWAVVGPKLSGLLGDPDYRGTTVIKSFITRVSSKSVLSSTPKNTHFSFTV